MHTYFAYGSNICPDRLKRRCPDIKPLAPAFTTDYQLTFPRTYDDPQYGGVASIEPITDKPISLPNQPLQVHGYLYQLSDNDLHRLDQYEGLAFNAYVRSTISVHVPPHFSNISSITTAWTYFAIPRPAPAVHHPPSKHYLNTIIRGATTHNLPENYINWLKSIQTLKIEPPPFHGREII
ncbi:gamma-glutamylcyclotransferase [Planctomycetota bacterium]|nr:gamma-glutamylcyclotransferase [Planctomycetota bacterium]